MFIEKKEAVLMHRFARIFLLARQYEDKRRSPRSEDCGHISNKLQVPTNPLRPGRQLERFYTLDILLESFDTEVVHVYELRCKRWQLARVHA